MHCKTLIISAVLLCIAVSGVTGQTFTSVYSSDIPGNDLDCGMSRSCRICGDYKAAENFCRENPSCAAFVWDTTCAYFKTAARPMKYKEKAMVLIKDDFGTDSGDDDQQQPSEDSEASPLDSQLAALLQIKAAIDKSGVLKTWKESSGFNGGYCSWGGDTVICDDQKNVVKLELDKKGLKGTLPSGEALSGLPYLQAIFMAKNNLMGTLPSDWGNLKQLEIIYLNTNKLQGTYPEGWSGMQSLKGLSIESNNLNGGVPSGWCSRMPALEYIRLDMRGCIPRNCAARGIEWNGYQRKSAQYQSWVC